MPGLNREWDKQDKEERRQLAFQMGRRMGGEPNLLKLVEKYNIPQTWVNMNRDMLANAWLAGAHPKPLPRPKPKGLGLAKEK